MPDHSNRGEDRSHGYEEYAEVFMRARNTRIGPRVMRDWAGQLAEGAEVLELGCGHGVISEVLVGAGPAGAGLAGAGVSLFAVDASPTLLAVFRKRFPGVRTECAAAQDSSFFKRRFDGVVAWGLIFLLEEESQRRLIAKMAEALKPGGQLVFTAPHERVEWIDSITERPSRSLGAAEYERLLNEAGLKVTPGTTDEGENYYFYAVRERDQ